MKVLLTAIVSSIAAMVIQPVVLLLWLVLPVVLSGADMPWLDLGPIFVYSALFAAPFVLLLGVPLSLILGHIGR